MIQQQIAPRHALSPCTCGAHPRLIETRGRKVIDPRLFGMPAQQFHVECVTCGAATRPVFSQPTAEHTWRHRSPSQLVDVAALPDLRIAAERSLLAIRPQPDLFAVLA